MYSLTRSRSEVLGGRNRFAVEKTKGHSLPNVAPKRGQRWAGGHNRFAVGGTAHISRRNLIAHVDRGSFTAQST
jgi:hypothetical protein